MKVSGLTVSGLNIAALAIIIKNQGITGYQINKLLPNVSHQQIYRNIADMSKSGIVFSDERPNPGKPPRKLISVVNQKNAVSALTEAVRVLPINNDTSTIELEALHQCLGVVPNETINGWLDRFIKHADSASQKADKAGAKADAMLRYGLILAARFIKEKADALEVAK